MTAALSLLLASCAFDVVSVNQIPVVIGPADVSAQEFTMQDNVEVRVSALYYRTLKKGTRWQVVGRISEGDVYRTQDQVLTVEASNISEAYLVVSAGKATGFYLPVEKTFSPLPHSVALTLSPGRPQ